MHKATGPHRIGIAGLPKEEKISDIPGGDLMDIMEEVHMVRSLLPIARRFFLAQLPISLIPLIALTATLAAAPSDPGNAHRAEVEGLTQAQISLNRQYRSERKGTPSEAAMLAEMVSVSVAVQRAQLLTALDEDNPGEIFRVALPDAIARQSSPATTS